MKLLLTTSSDKDLTGKIFEHLTGAKEIEIKLQEGRIVYLIFLTVPVRVIETSQQKAA